MDTIWMQLMRNNIIWMMWECYNGCVERHAETTPGPNTSEEQQGWRRLPKISRKDDWTGTGMWWWEMENTYWRKCWKRIFHGRGREDDRKQGERRVPTILDKYWTESRRIERDKGDVEKEDQESYRFERSNGLDTAVYKNYLYLYLYPFLASSCFFFSFILFPLSCGADVRWHSPPGSTVVHFISRQCLLFDIILHFVQPSSLRSSSLLPPCTFISIGPSFLHSAPRFSSHVHTTSTSFPGPSLWCLPLSLSLLFIHFLILSSFVNPYIHRSILISAISNLFSCVFFNAHVSAPYISAGFATVLSTFLFIFLSHITPDTLSQLFHSLCTMWVTSASSSPSSANVDPRYVNAFTLFTVSPCKWISASWCRSSIALLHSSSFLSTCSLLVLHSTMSSANSIHHGGCSLMPRPITSSIMSNR